MNFDVELEQEEDGRWIAAACEHCPVAEGSAI